MEIRKRDPIVGTSTANRFSRLVQHLSRPFSRTTGAKFASLNQTNQKILAEGLGLVTTGAGEQLEQRDFGSVPSGENQRRGPWAESCSSRRKKGEGTPLAENLRRSGQEVLAVVS